MRDRLFALAVVVLSVAALVKGGNWAAMSCMTVALACGLVGVASLEAMRVLFVLVAVLLGVSLVVEGHIVVGLLTAVAVPVVEARDIVRSVRRRCA